MITLAIDLGSTEFKAAIYDDARLIGSGGYKLAYHRKNAKVELPVEEVLSGFDTIINRAIEEAAVSITEISAIGISSQAQTFALMDEHNQPLTPFISWLDMRAGKSYKTISLPDFAEHSSITEPIPNMQLCLLKNLHERGQVMPLPSYVIKLLTGNFVTDNNLAAMTGLFSLRDKKYNKEALKLAEIQEEDLPEVIDIGEVAGKTAANPFGLPEGIPVYSCGNDQTAGACGAGLSPGDVLITLGTAQVVYCCCDKMPKPGSVPFRGNYPGGLFYAMSAENGGAVISHIIENYPEFKNFDTFAKLAEKGSVTSGIVYNPESEPEWSNLSGRIENRALAVLTYLVNRLESMVDAMQSVCDINKVYICGGGTKNKVWVDLISDALSREIILLDTSPCSGIISIIDNTFEQSQASQGAQ